jgi:curli biogenesis system outer membrane secretion channel CsgG
MRNRSFLLAAALLCAACSTSRRIKVQLNHPAQVNLSGAVALSAFSGDRGGEVGALLEEKLLETGGRFQVIDRTHMNAVMSELKLSASDLAQSNNAVKLGQLMTASAIISADVSDKYREEPHHHTFQDNTGRSHSSTTWEGEALVHADFRIIDVSTGRLLLAKVIEARKSWNGNPLGPTLGSFLVVNTGAEGAKPDREKLELEARTEVVAKLVAAVAPRKEYGEAEFETDSSIPQLEGGIGWASRGDWKHAQDTFNQSISAAETSAKVSSKALSKAYVDAGLAYVYAGDYDAGIKLLGKAYDLAQDSKILDRIDYAKELKLDSAKFDAQTASAQPGT